LTSEGKNPKANGEGPLAKSKNQMSEYKGRRQMSKN